MYGFPVHTLDALYTGQGVAVVVVVGVVVVVVVVAGVVVVVVVVVVVGAVVVVDVTVEEVDVAMAVPAPSPNGSQRTPVTLFTSAEPLSRIVRSASQLWSGSLLHVAPRNAIDTFAFEVTGNQVAPPSTLL